MTDIAYSKRPGEPCVPLTVRIEWLPDGTIMPLRYWTPDGTCFHIITQSECVQLAYLNEHGEGLRFTVRSEIIEAPVESAPLLHTRHETYLYLADGRFSARNIIDDRYLHGHKEYIPVTLDVFPNGDYALVSFRVRDERYMVEKTAAVEPRATFLAGGVGIYHKVEARLVVEGNNDSPDPQKSVNRMAALYLELNKWFVAVRKSA